MTVASDKSFNKYFDQYPTDGIKATFPINFRYDKASEIKVFLRDDSVLPKTEAAFVDFTTGDFLESPGINQIVTNSVLDSGSTLVIKRETDVSQDTTFALHDVTPAAVYEYSLDKLTLIVQEQSEKLRRTFLGQETSEVVYTLPAPDATKGIGWNSAGNGLENKEILEGPQGLQGVPGGIGLTGDPGTPGDIDWKGSFVAGNYIVNDTVEYEGSSYVCTNSTAGQLPTDTVFWDLVAGKGGKGDKGDQGDKGLKGDDGDQGNIGGTGLQGSQGIQGTQGEQGIAGKGDSIPLGTIMPYASETLPANGDWHFCHGQSLAKSVYPSLNTILAGAFGESGFNFNLPDFRGRFLRGRDNGVARDTDSGNRLASGVNGNIGDRVGSRQNDDVKALTAVMQNGGTIGSTAAILSGAGDGTPINRTNVVLGGGNGFETRPKNIYVEYIIKTRTSGDVSEGASFKDTGALAVVPTVGGYWIACDNGDFNKIKIVLGDSGSANSTVFTLRKKPANGGPTVTEANIAILHDSNALVSVSIDLLNDFTFLEDDVFWLEVAAVATGASNLTAILC